MVGREPLKGNRMKLFGKLILLSALFVFAACSGGGTTTPPSSGSGLTGSYTGEMVIGQSNPFVSEKVTFSIDASGKVTGTTLGTNNSGKPGGTGSFSGTMSLNGNFVVYSLSFTSADLGSYTVKGSNGFYAAATKQLGITNQAEKVGEPTFSGGFILSSTRQ